VTPDFERFAIGFDERDRARLHELWDGIIDRGQWSEGECTREFEQAWRQWNGLEAVAFSGWTGAALAALTWAQVAGEVVLCPSNTFMATPLAALHLGARVEFVDCNRDDLCMSFEDFERKVAQHRPKAAILVHIGGHIAFEVERIAELCRAEGIVLLEDCAHAHGADWNGRRPGSWGDAGLWSFYATKTISTGEGGMLVSPHAELLEFARLYRNYGKPEHVVQGLNLRLSEFTAAIGAVQVQRMEEIVAWKNASTSTLPIRRASSCPTGCARGSTSTSCSPSWNGRPGRSTTSRAIASWATRWICPTATGWPRITGVRRSTTGPDR
jgi:dTDP-4-amino-4,6-dideoxygalactose transaminase